MMPATATKTTLQQQQHQQRHIIKISNPTAIKEQSSMGIKKASPDFPTKLTAETTIKVTGPPTIVGNSKIMKQELRYLPVAIMPTKQNSNNNINNNNITLTNGNIQPITFSTPLQSTLAIITPGINLTNGTATTAPPPMLIRTTSVGQSSVTSAQNAARVKSSIKIKATPIQTTATVTTGAVTPTTAPALVALANNANVVIGTKQNVTTRPTTGTMIVTTNGNVAATAATTTNNITNAASVLTNGGIKTARLSNSGNARVLSPEQIKQLVKSGQINAKKTVVGTSNVIGTIGAPPLAKIGQPIVAVTSNKTPNGQSQHLQKQQKQQQQQQQQHFIQQKQFQTQKRNINITNNMLTTGTRPTTTLTKTTTTTIPSTVTATGMKSTTITEAKITLPPETKIIRNSLPTVLQKISKTSTTPQAPILVAKQINANSTSNNILLALTMPNVNKTECNGKPTNMNDITTSKRSELPENILRTQRSKSLNNDTGCAELSERRRSATPNLAKDDVVAKTKKQKIIETITINDDDEEDDNAGDEDDVDDDDDDEDEDDDDDDADNNSGDIENDMQIQTTERRASSINDANDADDEGSRDPVEKEETFTTIHAIDAIKCNQPKMEMVMANNSHASSQTASKTSNNNLSIVKAETLQLSKEDFVKSLQCDEEIRNTSSSTPSSNNSMSSHKSPEVVKSVSSNQTSPATSRITLAPFARIGNDAIVGCSASNTNNNSRSLLNTAAPMLAVKTAPTSPLTNAIECVETPKSTLNINSSTKLQDMFNMLSSFNMLSWRERLGYAGDSKLKFELNDFNLLQLRERCDKRLGPATHYERPLFERVERRRDNTDDPLLYLCKRCNCHGPASEFLAPKFCSISCLRRTGIKRKQPLPPNAPAPFDKKYRRTSLTTAQFSSESLVRKPFRWSEYLSDTSKGIAAPIHLFLNPFPVGPNYFERGMKLEAIDPENCSLFCVCSVVDVRGYRLKLNFDGYPSTYDFWINADSMDIFPPGWCRSTNRTLQPPNNYGNSRFSWDRYLNKTKSHAAPRHLFTHLNTSATPIINQFQIGMHMEAEDLNDTGKICVATVADVLDERIRVHFDGWDDCYDFWVHVSSPYIHPCGWHEGRQRLIVPPDYNRSVFKWSEYIKDNGGIAAPHELFIPREPMDFKPDMKLEVVDQRNPCLIRPATVVTRKGYRIQLHLDCWPSDYFFWLEDDSPDLHPIGWCEATTHELEAPPGYQSRPAQMPCDIEGCRGYGNAKRFHLNVHALRDCCPYAPENWRTKIVKPPRLSPSQIVHDFTKTKNIPSNISAPAVTTQPTMAPKQKAPRRQTAVLQQTSDLATTSIKRETESPSAQFNYIEISKRERKTSALTCGDDECATYMSVDPAQHVAVSISSPEPTAEFDARCIEIAKPFVADYGTRYARNYKLWQENSDFDMSAISSNPLYWTTWDVYEFVERTLNSEQLAKVIFEEDIDGRALLMLSQDDLTDHLDIKLGPAIKLFSTIVQLRIAVVCKFNTIDTGLNVLHSVEKFMTEKTRSVKTQTTNNARQVRRKRK